MPDQDLADAPTEAERVLRADRDAVDAALATYRKAVAKRAADLRLYRSRGHGVTEMARYVDLHRSQVNRIVTEAPTNEQD